MAKALHKDVKHIIRGKQLTVKAREVRKFIPKKREEKEEKKENTPLVTPEEIQEKLLQQECVTRTLLLNRSTGLYNMLH